MPGSLLTSSPVKKGHGKGRQKKTAKKSGIQVNFDYEIDLVETTAAKSRPKAVKKPKEVDKKPARAAKKPTAAIMKAPKTVKLQEDRNDNEAKCIHFI